MGDNNVVSNPGDWFVVSPRATAVTTCTRPPRPSRPARGAGAQYSYAGSTYLAAGLHASRYNSHPASPATPGVVFDPGKRPGHVDQQAAPRRPPHPVGHMGASPGMADGPCASSGRRDVFFGGLSSIAGGELRPPDDFLTRLALNPFQMRANRRRQDLVPLGVEVRRSLRTHPPAACRRHPSWRRRCRCSRVLARSNQPP